MTIRIVSLTSIPTRFADIGITIESLLCQNVDSINLYIPKSYRRFPDWDGTLPSVPQGVNIRRCEIDYGPATKILPAAREYRDVDAQILFCDDDCIVPPGWADRLFRIQSRRPSQAVANFGRHSYLTQKPSIFSLQPYVCHLKYDLRYRFLRLTSKILRISSPYHRPIYKPGLASVLFGVGGVVVRPHFFDAEAYDVPDEVFYVDDIWISATLARQGISIYVPAFGALPKAGLNASVSALVSSTFDNSNRLELNKKASLYCVAKHQIW